LLLKQVVVVAAAAAAAASSPLNHAHSAQKLLRVRARVKIRQQRQGGGGREVVGPQVVHAQQMKRERLNTRLGLRVNGVDCMNWINELRELQYGG
jgi:hypothetical protein